MCYYDKLSTYKLWIRVSVLYSIALAESICFLRTLIRPHHLVQQLTYDINDELYMYICSDNLRVNYPVFVLM